MSFTVNRRLTRMRGGGVQKEYVMFGPTNLEALRGKPYLVAKLYVARIRRLIRRTRERNICISVDTNCDLDISKVIHECMVSGPVYKGKKIKISYY
jgi:hypothetical protein